MLIELISLQPSPLLRALLAAALCLACGLAVGNAAIAWLLLRFREPIKSISPTVVRLHRHKQLTPTMGGIFLLIGVLAGTLLLADLRFPAVRVSLLAAVAFAGVGAIDDLVKLRTTKRGISVRAKLAGQLAAALPCAILLEASQGGGAISICMTILVLMIGANAVNVTDGLDGLAAGCGAITAAVMTLLLAFSTMSELSTVSASLTGVLLAFLRFNRHPARVFMGDTGSQMVGAVLAICALAGGSLQVFAICSGVFLAELASVVLQLMSYRLRGRRLFLCAPLHHHFQFAGWPEPGIVRRFWYVGVLFAAAGIANTEFEKRNSSFNDPPPGNLASVSRVEGSRSAAKGVVETAFAMKDKRNP